MKLNPRKVEELAERLFACFGGAEFAAGDIVTRFAAQPLKEPNNQKLKAAVRALIGGRLTKQRVGQLLNLHIVDGGTAWEGEHLRIEARHDAHSKAWRYRIVDLRPKLDAAAKAALRELENRQDEQAAAFEAELDSLPPDRALTKLEQHIAREQRNIEKLEESLRRAEAAQERREFRRLERQHEAASTELTRVAAALGQPAPTRKAVLGRGEELERDIAAYRDELARLKGSDDYQRIAAEIAKTPHVVTPELVRTIKEIEALRNGQHWRAGMSVDPGDYRDYSSGRFSRAWGPSKLRPAVHLTPNWSPFKF